MEPVTLFLLVILLGLIVVFVTRPFFNRRHFHSSENAHEKSSLLAERERLLTALQELDFDQSLGKIPAEDYPAQRAVLLQKGAEVLRRLDMLSPEVKYKKGKVDKGPSSEFNHDASITDDDLEDLLAKRRSTHKDKTAGFCPKCGKPVITSDVFCPACGNTLKS